MILNKEIEFPNIIIETVGIINSFGIDFEIFPRSSASNGGVSNEYFLLDQIIIKEDMFSEAIFGSISFFDSVYAIDQLKLTSSLDSVYFQFSDTRGQGDLQQYRILDITVSSDIASKAVHGPVGTVNHITIRFSSDSFVNKNFDTLFDSNYIGKISKNVSLSIEEKSSSTSQVPTGLTGFDSDEYTKHEALMSGFVQDMMDKFTKKDDTDADQSPQKPLKADDTYNDIWVKTENFFYPLYKIGNNLRISQLMNYICEYACYKDNPKAVNFFFWEDLDHWNFRCVESLIKDTNNYKGEYFLINKGIDENWYNVIVSMEVISDISPVKLYDGGAAFSEYIRIKPDWGYPYRGFLDSTNSLRREQITYNYKDDANKWERIAAYSPFTSFIETKYKKRQDYGTVRLSDLNYGFYSNAYNAKNLPWWNQYDFSSPNGYLGNKLALPEEAGGYDIHNKRDLFDKHPGSKEVSRIDTEYWQAQFDFCELPGAFLRTIYKDIKWALTEARTIYADAKATKIQWDVYRNTICCCDVAPPKSFFAYVWYASSISGLAGSNSILKPAMFKYFWKQVELWPRKEIDKITDTSYEIIQSESQSFHFAFISSPKFLSGEAYNLNELLNSFAPSGFENIDGISGSVDDAGKPTTNKTLTFGPGISVPYNLLPYPQSNLPDDVRKRITSYPTSYQMRAIGSYKITQRACGNYPNEGTISSVNGGLNIGNTGAAGRRVQDYFGGKIVQMYAIPSDMMQNIKGYTQSNSRGGIKQQPYMYVFDSENAHDGTCGVTSDSKNVEGCKQPTIFS
jgi:hypothetical protein